MLEIRGLKIATAAVLAAGLLLGAGAFAQDEQQSGAQQTRRTPTMREKVYQPLTEAQACAE